MKTKSIKKLQLSKKAIVKLNGDAASQVNGGTGIPASLLCPSHSICPPGVYCY